MSIPQEFQDKFIREIAGKQPHEVLQIINKYSAIDYNGMSRFVIKKEFELLKEKAEAKRKQACSECEFKRIPKGVVDELANKYAKEPRQIYNIIKS